ncbi:collagen binding domain-containing protein [Lactococcus piscium]|uniref:Cna B-type domain-containing protein n=2 Tax=Pseudolactococcus carnosus TaxID=2749961 RepID=A0ABT0AQ87_9LACT|nr:collagen binding domain-containing protein [Lactococcus piscium]MCJ1988870.1 Cna B-type domain-containing protein [Lactococcus carnosus]
MTVIILLQYVSPILAVANTLDEKNDLVSLKSAKISKQDDQTVTVDLKVTANNVTEQTAKTKIEFSNKAIVFKEALNQLTTSKNQYKLNGQVLEATIAPNTSKEENNLSIKLDKASLKGIDNVQVSSGDSKTTLDLSGVTQLPEKSVTTESSSKTNESTSPASSTTSSSSKEEAAKEDDTKKATIKEKKTTAAKLTDAEPQANRLNDYLEEDSKGTIFTNVSLNFLDKDKKPVDPNDFKADGTVDLSYAWAIPNHLKNDYTLKNGDFFEFSLPDNLVYESSSGTLKNDKTGKDYGVFQINSDGRVRFTFNNVTDVSDIDGVFNYSRSKIKSTVPGKTEIKIPLTSGVQSQPIIIKPTGGDNIKKTGAFDKNPNPSKIDWDVTINTNGNHLVNAVVSDAFPPGNTYDSVEVFPLTIDTKGNVTGQGKALNRDSDYTVDSKGTVTFNAPYKDTYSAFKLTYHTTIDQAVKPNDGTPAGGLPFTNTATLNNNGVESSNAATLTATYGSLLAKKFVSIDTGGYQILNWKIDYNGGEKSLPNDTQLVDTLSGDQIFTDDGLKIVDTSGKPINYTVVYDSTKKKMTIKFPNGLNQKATITYKSKVTVPLTSAGIGQLTNTAESNGKTVSTDPQTVTSQGLVKTLGSTDYNKRTVSWNLDINRGRQTMTNWSMTETIPEGLTVIDDSITFKNLDHPRILTKGIDYSITKTGNGFKVTFINPLVKENSDRYSFSFNTAFETLQLPNTGKWTNNATIDWTDINNEPHTDSSKADFTPKTEFKNDGSKSGSYDATSKKISWVVSANYNQRILTGASIEDVLTDDQEFVAGSAKLFSGDVDLTGKISNLQEVTWITPTYDLATRKVSVNLPEGAKAYVLTFDTSLADKVIHLLPYTNSAKYTNNGKTSNLSAAVTVPNGGSFIGKSGSLDTDRAYAIWNISVNNSQSTIDKGLTVTDIPSPNQTIIADSIKIYGTTVDKTGKVTLDKSIVLEKDKAYTVDLQTNSETGEQKLIIVFNNQVTTPYIIQYRVFINSPLIDVKLGNKASIVGNGTDVKDGVVAKEVEVTNQSGSSNGKNLKLVLTKVDKDDNQKLLSGVKFDLYSSVADQKGVLLRSGTTDQDGKINWGNIKSGKYFLVETSTLTSYDIPNDLKTGRLITVSSDKSDTNLNFQVKVDNEKTKVSVKGSKIWDDKDNQDGVRPSKITVNLLKDGDPFK